MRLDVSLSQKLSLQLKLAPQIIQSIEILQLPALSLQELVETALQENEALEREDDEAAPTGAPSDAVTPGETPNGQATEAENEMAAVADTLEKLEALETAAERDWQDFGPRRASGGEGDDAKFEAMNNTAAGETSLPDELYDQFVMLEAPEMGEEMRTIGRHIIYNLDESGLLPYSLEEILETPELRGRFNLEQAERALKLVQRLEPKGVGARSISEVLLLQLDPDDPDREIKEKILRDHLEDIYKNKRPKVARDLGISVPELNRLVEQISHLDPRPGSGLGGDRNAYVHPDVIVEWIEGKWEIRLEESFFPRIRVSPHYRDMLANSDDPKVRDYVRKKLENAKWLVDAIQQRQSTLSRVCHEIFGAQQEYLEYGASHLKPLKMQEVADRVGIHVSTVSRAIADKWAQTPRGIVPLKYFFTGGSETSDGESLSRMSVKEKVRAIIGGESKTSPFSDEEVAERLKQEGLDIARRTVTKYRKALRIPSSRQRREWV